MKAFSLGGNTTEYVDRPLPPTSGLKPGLNTIAIHCHQTGGGQYIDAGVELQAPVQ